MEGRRKQEVIAKPMPLQIGRAVSVTGLILAWRTGETGELRENLLHLLISLLNQPLLSVRAGREAQGVRRSGPGACAFCRTGVRTSSRWCTLRPPLVHAPSTAGVRSVPRWCTHQPCRQVDKICRQTMPHLAANLWYNGGKSLPNTEANAPTTGNKAQKKQETKRKHT